MARCSECLHRVDDHEWSGCTASTHTLMPYDCNCPRTPGHFSNKTVKVLCSAELRSEDPAAENYRCELEHGHLLRGVDHKDGDLHWTDGIAVYPATRFRPALAPVASPGRVTKDSGVRAEYDSGMVRDTQEGKARFELLLPLGVPYQDQFLVRVAELMARGAEKYDARNWEKANGVEELERFKSSALRHLFQWAAGETDEDHAAAVVFNLLGYETTKAKVDGQG